jgi:uncharacterized protein
MSFSAALDHPDIVSKLLQPPPQSRQLPPPGAEDVAFSANEATLIGRFFTAGKDLPSLLYFHGGGESIDTFAEEAESYRNVGFNVFLFSYRGFAGSTGSPSLTTLLIDAEGQFLHGINWLTAKGYTGAMFVVGRSVGSLCAVDNASHHQDKLKGLILESAYCQLQPLLTNLGLETLACEFNEDDEFGMLRNLETIKLATSIFHGAKDHLVPVALAEKLQAASAAKTKQFLLIPGAQHGDVAKTAGHLYFTAIKSFVDTVCGVNTWRDKRRRFQARKSDNS